MPISADYLIVGQGLAGSHLAWALEQREQAVYIVDDGHKTAASRVAAGILNPITGRRLVKSWDIETYLPFARDFYLQMEKMLQCACFTPRNIIRLLKNKEEQVRLEKRLQDPEYQPFLETSNHLDTEYPPLVSPLGSFTIKHAGTVHLPQYLEALRQYFKAKDRLITESFNPEALKLTPQGVTWKHIHARVLIFCQGWRNDTNSWFGSLPFQHAKGEILTLKTSGFKTSDIINKKKWIVPLDEQTVRIGATYNTEHLDLQVTESGRDELIHAFAGIVDTTSAPQVIEHSVGVRPCSHDTLPYMGRHPVHPQLAIFNGFSSKGTLMTPLCAQHMADFLEDQKPMNPAFHIDRIQSL